MENTIIKLTNIHKTYSKNEVVKGIDLEVKEGEFLTLLGPSGCGKTTTLRMIAGFEDVTSGTIEISGKDVTKLAPYKRNVNTVFQNYALFPHMDIFENIAYPLQIKGEKKSAIKEKVASILNTVQLSGFENRRVEELSGGQKQRIAIARALVAGPKVLLLDEPLGALDFKLRKQMQLELKRLQKTLGITFIYVTHDQEEAMTMSDRIAVMNEGVIEQIDEPKVIYNKPVTKFVADFIGDSNIFEGKLVDEKDGKYIYSTVDGLISSDTKLEGEKVFILVRPEVAQLKSEPTNSYSIKVPVTELILTGNLVKLVCVTDSGKEIFISRLSGSDIPGIGSVGYLYSDIDKTVVMDR